MIKALNGQDDDSTGKILEAIHKIDPHAPIVQLDTITINSAIDELLDGKLKEQAAKFFGLGKGGPEPWWKYCTRDEFADFVNKIAAQNQNTCRAFAAVILAKEPGLKNVFKSLPPE
ncbi:MAG TPA: hypothetical protein VFC07_07140 [Verrucomicrobiae bacterium]|nr:hypothetical protein [Verrucomicrobiae bacterium]